MIDLDGLIRELSVERPVFHSEADFQHALAWKIHKKYPKMSVKLERRVELEDKEIYIDIFLKDKEKYRTDGAEV